MEGKVFLKSLSLKNLLSFGPEGVEVELQPLNVLIGANGSGKSNFIEAIRLLCATPDDDITKSFGGLRDVIWKGVQDTANLNAQVRAVAAGGAVSGFDEEYAHDFGFGFRDFRLRFTHEKIEVMRPNKADVMSVYWYSGDGTAYLNWTNEPGYAQGAQLGDTKINAYPGQSVLYSIKHPDFPGITSLAQAYQSTRFYTDLRVAKSSSLRLPQDATLAGDFLDEDGGNLAVVLQGIRLDRDRWHDLRNQLIVFNDRVSDITVELNADTFQMYVKESGLEHLVSAARLSDGTLRYLCLLSILCHPKPPPLVCIDEPELGMHPDIIPTIAKMLIEASARMQLIVTTHSDLLISALHDVPEAVLVCDRLDQGTRIRRLDPDQVAAWLKEYSLGECWLRGAFGGTRW